MHTRSAMPTPGALMAAEIAEQPAALRRLLDATAGRTRPQARRRDRALPTRASSCSPPAARATTPRCTGSTWPRCAHPAGRAWRRRRPFTVYGARPDMSGVLFVAVSQSGGSPDLVESMEVAARVRRADRRGDEQRRTRRWRAPRPTTSTCWPARSGPSPRPRPTPPSCSRCICCWSAATPAPCRTPPPAPSRTVRRPTPRPSGSGSSTGWSRPPAASPTRPRARVR